MQATSTFARAIRIGLVLILLLVALASEATVGRAAARTPTPQDSESDATPWKAGVGVDFEDGSLSGWESAAAVVQKKHAAEGARAVRITAKKSPGYLSRPLDKPQAELSFQFAVDVLAQDDSPLVLVQLQTIDGEPVLTLLSDSKGMLALQIADNSYIESNASIDDGAFHRLSIHVKTGDNGAASVELDQHPVDALAVSGGLPKTAVAVVQFGVVSSRHSFDLALDEMVWTSGPSHLAAAGLRSAKKITVPAADAVRSNDPVLRWLPEITAAAQATGVPPSLIAGVMALESGGDPSTVSVAGAVGLMQIMPDELAAHGVGYDSGFDPATNIMTGARILAERSGAGWELATGYYFGIGCDAYLTCTADYVRAALAWAAWYAPALNDPFRGDPSVIPASWEISPATETPTATPSPTTTKTPTSTPKPKAAKTSSPVIQATSTPTNAAALTPIPTAAPVETPAATATDAPTDIPTDVPTEIPPTDVPTDTPTEIPTEVPTDTPTDTPVPDVTTPAD